MSDLKKDIRLNSTCFDQLEVEAHVSTAEIEAGDLLILVSEMVLLLT